MGDAGSRAAGAARPRRRWLVVALAVVTAAAGCGRSDGSDATKAEPEAGTWRTWVLASPSQVEVPPPPREGSAEARAEAGEVARLARGRTGADRAQAHRWGDYPALAPWVEKNLELVSQKRVNPVRAARGYGLMSVAINDAVVSAWHWKYVYDREAPDGTDPVVPAGHDPSYPSEHAAIAGAASRVLAYLSPDGGPAYDDMAREAADSRVRAGTNYRSDVEAGLALGRAVAERVVARARSDGADGQAAPVAAPPQGRGVWTPPPEGNPALKPLEPSAGRWRSWIPALVEQVRPGPPPAYGSPQFVEEAREVATIGNSLTARQKQMVVRWLGPPGSPTPPGLWNQIALDEVRRSRLTIPRMAQAFAVLNIAEADAAVAVWDCKYTYWSARPVNAIRDLGIDPRWKPFTATPVFPSYVSGHSTFSAAAAEVLGQLFPERAERMRAMADEAGRSRIYGGIHYQSDNVVGQRMGRQIGRLALQTAGLLGAT